MVRENGRRRVAIYCRVSTVDQDCDRQERDLLEHAERAGYEVVGVFKETLSGIRKSRGKQPLERKKVMALAQRRIAEKLGISKTTVNEVLKRERRRGSGARPSALQG